MSSYVRREYPQWSWSFSRQQLFGTCPRRYYYNYYGSHNGWEYNAPAEAALAYRLKKLSNIYMVLGDAVHKSANEVARLVVQGKQPLSPAEIEALVREELRRAWLSSQKQRQLFLKRPNRVTMLHEFYYGEGPKEETVDRINERIPIVSAALAASPTWQELQALGSDFIAAEQFDTFPLGGTPVYAVPDLIFRMATGIFLIVDWKTGEQMGDNADQVALYSLYVHLKHGVPVAKIKARLEYLSLGEVVELSFTEADLEKVRQRALASMDKMRGFLADVELNAPLAKRQFPLTKERGQCPYCNFYELCREELAAAPEVS